jgi:hypothetical protein
MLTDGDGHFLYYGLTRGNYSINVNATGYLAGNYGQRKPGGGSQTLSLTDGQRLGDVVIKLWQYAAIIGTVSDEAGEPLVNVNVQLMRRTTINGRQRFTSGPSTRTDDRGVFRAGTLTPGDYVVTVPSSQTTMPTSVIDAYQQAIAAGGNAAQEFSRQLQSSRAPSPNSGGLLIGQARLQANGSPTSAFLSASGDRVFVYPTVYYPSARTVAEAAIIKVDSGEEHPGVDLQLHAVPTSSVYGTVIGPAGPGANIGLRLLLSGVDQSASENGFDAATTVSDGDGAFTFLGVPEGVYSLRALVVPQPNGRGAPPPPPPPAPGRGAAPVAAARPAPPPVLWATTPISVGHDDVDRVAVVLRNGLHVSGRLVFDGSTAPPATSRLQQLTMSLSPTDPQSMNVQMQPGRVDTEGRFTIDNLVPGRYTTNGANVSPWVIKTAVVNGRDVLENGFDLDADISDLVITYSDRPSSLAGSVSNGTEAAVTGIQVLLFPADVRSWIEAGASSRRIRSARPGSSGAYSMSNVVPGNYLIVALTDDDAADWPDPPFIETIAKIAQFVTIGEGDKKTMDLTPSRIIK